MSEQQPATLYRATANIPELGARAGDLVAIFANTVHVVRELRHLAGGGWVGVRVPVLTPEIATSLLALD